MPNKWQDQIGRHFILNHTPKTLVSVVPSLTETFIHCCPPGSVTGRTKFCIHPKIKVASIPRIGGTKHLKADEIIRLNPDIIIANKEENTAEDIDQLSDKIPVYVSDIYDTHSLKEFLRDMAIIFQLNSFNQLISQLDKKKSTFIHREDKKRVVYLIWRNPYMTIGGGTYINHMLEQAGFINLFQHKRRYPKVSMEEILDMNPDYIFLSSEPFPFKQKHIDELSVKYSRKRIKIVDGEVFSWYGVRNLKAYEYFEFLHKDL